VGSFFTCQVVEIILREHTAEAGNNGVIGQIAEGDVGEAFGDKRIGCDIFADAGCPHKPMIFISLELYCLVPSVDDHDQIQGKYSIGRAFLAISGNVNAPLLLMLENQGNVYFPRAPRLRSTHINELDRLVSQHPLNEHIHQRVIGCQDRVARSREPIKELLGWEELGVQANLQKVPRRTISYNFHAPQITSGGWTKAVQARNLY
jgi:hypothetical protein